MKLFSIFQRKSQEKAEVAKAHSVEELSEEEMKRVQGASSTQMNEHLYDSYTWGSNNRRMML